MIDRIPPSTLNLSYAEWVHFVSTNKFSLRLIPWLAAWNSTDFARSPMPDSDRKLLRYGHYIGFFDGRRI